MDGFLGWECAFDPYVASLVVLSFQIRSESISMCKGSKIWKGATGPTPYKFALPRLAILQNSAAFHQMV